MPEESDVGLGGSDLELSVRRGELAGDLEPRPARERPETRQAANDEPGDRRRRWRSGRASRDGRARRRRRRSSGRGCRVGGLGRRAGGVAPDVGTGVGVGVGGRGRLWGSASASGPASGSARWSGSACALGCGRRRRRRGRRRGRCGRGRRSRCSERQLAVERRLDPIAAGPGPGAVALSERAGHRRDHPGRDGPAAERVRPDDGTNRTGSVVDRDREPVRELVRRSGDGAGDDDPASFGGLAGRSGRESDGGREVGRSARERSTPPRSAACAASTGSTTRALDGDRACPAGQSPTTGASR